VGSLRRKYATKALPVGAVIVIKRGRRVARWTGRPGTVHEAEVVVGRDGSERIKVDTKCWYAKYLRADGTQDERTTGCRDKRMASQLLAEWEAQEEKIKSGLASAADFVRAASGQAPLASHLDSYVSHLATAGTTERHQRETRAKIERIAADCGWRRLSEVTGNGFAHWLDLRHSEGMGATTRNRHVEALRAFVRWAVKAGRLATDPLVSVDKVDARADRRRERRALTADELARLLQAARERPLHEIHIVTRGPNKDKLGAKPSARSVARATALGHERALIYKTLTLTGLRRGELASLTVARAVLDDDRPHLLLDAADEKSRRGARIELRDDLAEDLRGWLRDRLERARRAAAAKGHTPPLRLDPNAKLLEVPTSLVKILDRDLKFAKIAKKDDLGRTIDVHSLRHSHASHLARAGVPLRTAQAAMRHSDPKLTANSYQDPHLIDVRGALDALPALPLDGGVHDNEVAALRRAVGGDAEGAVRLAPGLAPTSVQTCTFQFSRPLGVPNEDTAPPNATTRKNPAGEPSEPVFGEGDHRGSGSGGRIRTCDLRVMSPTSYQTAPPRVPL
jgi:integrase